MFRSSVNIIGVQKLPLAGLALVAFCCAFAVALLFYHPLPSPSVVGERVENVTTCIDQYAQKDPQGDRAMPALWDAYNFCHSVVATEFLTKEQIVRNAAFADQRYENLVLLCMVVAITVSGVALAGLQLLGSYRLAQVGRATFGGGGEATISANSVAVRSSVVGVVILAISFAFFLVFVLYVYTIQEVGGTAANNIAAQPAHQIWSGAIQPLPQKPIASPPAADAPQSRRELSRP